VPRKGEKASVQWDRMVTARLAEMERLMPGRGSVEGAFWDKRAERFAANVKLPGDDDPFLRRLRRVAGPDSTALDVGAGTGRYALALAGDVRHVTALDASKGMLKVLRRRARESDVRNVTSVHARWQDAQVKPADIVFSSFVLTVVPGVRTFLAKLDAAAKEHVLLYLGAYSGDAIFDPLWRHFHGGSRAPGPTYLDALAVLRELHIEADVRVVELSNRKRFATVDEAVEHYLEWLVVPDTPEVREELAGLLAHWLLGRRGSYRSPLRSQPAAIIHWSPQASS
jgi:SAM-dependent methyltransferase